MIGIDILFVDRMSFIFDSFDFITACTTYHAATINIDAQVVLSSRYYFVSSCVQSPLYAGERISPGNHVR